jgi:hypothetical protein
LINYQDALVGVTPFHVTTDNEDEPVTELFLTTHCNVDLQTKDRCLVVAADVRPSGGVGLTSDAWRHPLVRPDVRPFFFENFFDFFFEKK